MILIKIILKYKSFFSGIILKQPFLKKHDGYLIVKRFFLSLMLLFLFNKNIFSQPVYNNQVYNGKRFKTIVIAESAVTTVGLIGLHYLWYKKFPHSRFHFFDDSKEWLNMDKAGHATTSYNLSAVQFNMMSYAGIKNNQATWIGGLTSLGFQTIIEIFDGFSQKWGFSKTDMLANIIGTSLFMTQQFAYKEQRVQMKFSFHHSIYAKYNPAELGSNKWQRWLKDYNGQTYWISVNPASFMKSNTEFPGWLNASIGYGADGMTGGSKNASEINGKPIPTFKRQRKYYFSLDANLKNIDRKNLNTKVLLVIPEIFKLPFPTVEFKTNSTVKFHWVYF
jgi:uncharacterized protein YfiM (DUF2279 family)